MTLEDLKELMPYIIPIIIGFIAALPALAALRAQKHKDKSEATKTITDAASTLVGNLTNNNRGLRIMLEKHDKRVEKLEHEIECNKRKMSDQEGDLSKSKSELTVRAKQILDLQAITSTQIHTIALLQGQVTGLEKELKFTEKGE